MLEQDNTGIGAGFPKILNHLQLHVYVGLEVPQSRVEALERQQSVFVNMQVLKRLLKGELYRGWYRDYYRGY